MRAPALRLYGDEIIVDSFAGGGGASLGIEWALGRSPDVAINHDREAIAMHAANHPETRHFCEDVWKVDPREACKARPALLWASPDCKHFSKAKGGKPVDKKIRGLAWIVVRWAKAVKPRVIILENVEEFEDWGPLLDNGKPDPSRMGLTFRIWRGKLEALGYRVEHRELVAANYGAPTTRKRLYLIARCDGQPIVWPDQTHDQHGRSLRIEWRTAAECIDWARPTYSIFLTNEEGRQHGVKRPLAENTMRRVYRGFEKFVLQNPRPYLMTLNHGQRWHRARGLEEPMRTLTGSHDAHALVAPIITEHANASNPRSWRADEPLRTQCAQVKGGHFALAAAFMVPRYGEDPNPKRRGGKGQAPRARSVELPMPTIVPSQNGAQLVAAFMAKHYGGGANKETRGSSMQRPLDTVTARDHNHIVASSLIKLKGTCAHGQQLTLPLATVQAGGLHYAETRAFLVKYYGANDAVRVDTPMPTATGLDRFGLVTVHGEQYVVADIGMRMLAARELYRAQGFPDEYLINVELDGKPLTNKAQVRMVGNSVCPPVAAALARAQFEDQVIEVAA
jgi:DNA (cytosine-5)-methyltransferase 1